MLDAPHFERMRNGAILANAGGVDVEIDTAGLRAVASNVRVVRRNFEEFALGDGRRLYLVGRGLVVNLAAGSQVIVGAAAAALTYVLGTILGTLVGG